MYITNTVVKKYTKLSQFVTNTFVRKHNKMSKLVTDILVTNILVTKYTKLTKFVFICDTSTNTNEIRNNKVNNINLS